MATVAQHLEQFERNLAVSSRLEASDDFDWAVTTLFYAALHLMQAYMIQHDLKADSHRRREQLMLAHSGLRIVVDQYRALRSLSEHARYECRRFSREEFESIRNGSFATVTTHLRSLLGVSS